MPQTVSGEGFRDFSEPRFFEGTSLADIAAIRNPVDKAHAIIGATLGGSFEIFKFSQGDTATDDGIDVIAPLNPGVNGRWHRTVTNEINVRTFGAKGDGVTDDTSAINLALTAAAVGVTKQIQFPPGTYKINSLTFPSTLSLLFARGAVLSINAGQTLTINAQINAESATIFAGTGTVAIGPSKNPALLPQWFSATGNGVTDDTAAVQKTLDVLTAMGAGAMQLDGNFLVTSTLNLVVSGGTFGRGLCILGSSANGATLTRIAGSGYIFKIEGQSFLHFRDVQFVGPGASGTVHGILINSVNNPTTQQVFLERLRFTDLSDGIVIGDYTANSISAQIDACAFKDVRMDRIRRGIIVRSNNAQLTRIDHCRIGLDATSGLSCIQLGESPALGGVHVGYGQVDIVGTDGGGGPAGAAFLRILGPNSPCTVDTCWIEAITHALYFDPTASVGNPGNIVFLNTACYGALTFQATCNAVFVGCVFRGIALNSGALFGTFIQSNFENNTYGFTGAATANAVIDWQDGAVLRRTRTGTIASPRQPTANLGGVNAAVVCVDNTTAMSSGVNSYTFTWAPATGNVKPLVEPVAKVWLLDPANTAANLVNYWTSVNAGTGVITLNVRLAGAVTLNAQLKFFIELVDRPF